MCWPIWRLRKTEDWTFNWSSIKNSPDFIDLSYCKRNENFSFLFGFGAITGYIALIATTINRGSHFNILLSEWSTSIFRSFSVMLIHFRSTTSLSWSWNRFWSHFHLNWSSPSRMCRRIWRQYCNLRSNSKYYRYCINSQQILRNFQILFFMPTEVILIPYNLLFWVVPYACLSIKEYFRYLIELHLLLITIIQWIFVHLKTLFQISFSPLWVKFYELSYRCINKCARR